MPPVFLPRQSTSPRGPEPRSPPRPHRCAPHRVRTAELLGELLSPWQWGSSESSRTAPRIPQLGNGSQSPRGSPWILRSSLKTSPAAPALCSPCPLALAIYPRPHMFSWPPHPQCRFLTDSSTGSISLKPDRSPNPTTRATARSSHGIPTVLNTTRCTEIPSTFTLQSALKLVAGCFRCRGKAEGQAEGIAAALSNVLTVVQEQRSKE